MRKWILLSLTMLLASGCARVTEECGNKTVVLWPQAGTNSYTFREVVLTTLNSLYELSGSAARVYYEGTLGGSGYEGEVARPRFTQSGDVCVPMDTASSLSVSIYAQFESLYKFEREMGTASLLSWPRSVGVDILMQPTYGSAHNNAHYFSVGDAVAVLPYSGKGLPLTLNHGVIAHEHFHAHFQRQVISVLNAALPSYAPIDELFYAGIKPVEEFDNADLSTARGLNNFVVRGWNEGLADLYGAIYTDNPTFFSASLPRLNEARALNGELKPFESGADLQARAGSALRPIDIVGFSYEQGMILARLMYRLAGLDPEGPKAFLARMLRRLNAIPAAVYPLYDVRVLDFEMIVPLMLDGYEFTGQACGYVAETVSRETMRRMSACGAR